LAVDERACLIVRRELPREGTHKADVIAMIQRKGGATLDEIMKTTGWQKHTVRGFISILGSKGGIKVTSTRRESDGARVYDA
jgi:transcription initiation factor IIE alpha subunit